jgi:hypothetical protein
MHYYNISVNERQQKVERTLDYDRFPFGCGFIILFLVLAACTYKRGSTLGVFCTWDFNSNYLGSGVWPSHEGLKTRTIKKSTYDLANAYLGNRMGRLHHIAENSCSYEYIARLTSVYGDFE